MDIGLLNSPPDDQIEMMVRTIHTEKPASKIVGAGGPVHTSTMMSFNECGSLPQHFQSPPTLFNSAQTTIYFSNNNKNNIINIIPSLQPNSFPSYSNNNSSSSENGTLLLPSPVITSSSQKQTSMVAMREMIFRIAAMQPINIDPEAVKLPKRRNVRISKDPQSVAARHRRERISERIRILQRLVPGGTKMDTASMLDEAIHYVKFLKTQVQSLERVAVNNNNNHPIVTPIPPPVAAGFSFPVSGSSGGGGFNYCRGAHQIHMNVSPHNIQQFSDA